MSTDSTVDSNILERAKDNGLKVTADGRIVLPGTLSDKPAKTKAPKATKKTEPKVTAPKAPKEFKGISSKIVSTGLDTITNIADGLNTLKSVVTRENITCPYKVSTYKNEFRVAFDSVKAIDLLTMMNTDEVNSFNQTGFFIPDKKDFFALKIAE